MKNTITELVYSECENCKICCHQGVTEGICSYSMIEAILDKKIPEELIKKLVIFKIPLNKMDFCAKKWWHFPKINILYNLSFPEDGFIELLSIPTAKEDEDCIFMTEIGCEYPEIKSLDCCLFPYHYYKGEFLIETWCGLTKHLNQDDIDRVKQEIWDITEKYAQLCIINQNNYFSKLKVIRKIYDFAVILI